MQDDADTSPNGAQNHRASVGDNIQSFPILVNASQEGLECLGNSATDAFVLVYLIGTLDFV